MNNISESFDVGRLAAALEGSMFGKNIIFKETIGSTNVFLKELAKEGATEGTLVIADEQSAGLGRLGRKWLSRKGENLLFSVLFRPDLAPEKLFVLTMIFALAGVKAVHEAGGFEAGIKWPNDIYVETKKLGGVLTEFSVLDGKIQYVVLGMGLNVNWRPPAEITSKYGTTSILKETGVKISRERLLISLLKHLGRYYGIVSSKNQDSAVFYERWNEKSVLLGKPVIVQMGNDIIEGEAAGIDRDGALSVVTADGEKKIRAGDVSVKIVNGRRDA